MRCRKLVVLLSASLTIAGLPSIAQAKKIYPAEIMARDLNYPGLGWLGHVGIATANMSSPSGMNQDAYQVIEILNESVVGQINSISNFKARSPYWGSKYGVADRGVAGYNLLVEANHQRWWCPVYTANTDYHIGSGIPTTGQVIECGRWRCDAYAWWAFYSQGYDTMPGHVWLPRNMFNYFPRFNDERLKEEEPSAPSAVVLDRTLEAVSAQDRVLKQFTDFNRTYSAFDGIDLIDKIIRKAQHLLNCAETISREAILFSDNDYRLHSIKNSDNEYWRAGFLVNWAKNISKFQLPNEILAFDNNDDIVNETSMKNLITLSGDILYHEGWFNVEICPALRVYI